MKLLLTSAGIKNPTIHGALVGLLDKPIAESNALCIPTGAYGSPYSTPAGPWRFLSGRSDQPMTELGWKSLGVLELTALPSVGSDRWVEWVRETDALLVNGGDALYLCHWMRESGLADLLPSLRDTVWVSFSAGSMVLTPRIGEDFVGWKSPSGSDETMTNREDRDDPDDSHQCPVAGKQAELARRMVELGPDVEALGRCEDASVAYGWPRS
jgi:dipeptidase E